MSTKENILLLTYLLMVCMYTVGWIITRNKKKYEYTHSSFELAILLLIPIIPIVLLIKSLIKKKKASVV